LVWLTVSEVPVHGQLAPLFLACGEAAHHGRESEVVLSCSPSWWLGSKEREEGRVKIHLSRAHPQ
jgi:hypothetical protein